MKIKYFTLNSLRHKDKPESRTKEKSPEKDKKTDSFGGRYKDRTKENNLDSVAKAESEAQRRGYLLFVVAILNSILLQRENFETVIKTHVQYLLVTCLSGPPKRSCTSFLRKLEKW